MARYLCIDGPLEGRSFTWRRPPSRDRATTVALLDLEHGLLEVAYRVQTPADVSGPGVLTFVGETEDVRRRSRGRAAVPLIH